MHLTLEGQLEHLHVALEERVVNGLARRERGKVALSRIKRSTHKNELETVQRARIFSANNRPVPRMPATTRAKEAFLRRG